MSRKRSLLFAFIMVTALAVSGAAPQPAQGAEPKVCGIVAVHVRATALVPGTLTVGATSLMIAPGTNLESIVAVGANLCLDLTLNSDNQITDATVTANVSSTRSICGKVTRYDAPTAIAAGALAIDGGTSVIAVGTTLPPSVNFGADLCMRLTLNGHGQISSAVIQANVTATLDLCGVVERYVAGTAAGYGSLAIADRAFVVAIRALLPDSVALGANLCMRLTLNGFGQISGGTAQANLPSAFQVCGQVDIFMAATNAGAGLITIGGTTHPIVAGTALSSAITGKAFLKLRLTLDGFMRITGADVLKVGVAVADVCKSPTVLIPPPSADGASAPNSNPGTSTSPGASGSPAPERPRNSIPSGPNGYQRPSDRPDAGAETQAGRKNACGCHRAPVQRGSDVDAGQFLPDTASLSRTAMAILQVSLPLLLLLFGLLGHELVLRRRNLAAARGRDVGVPQT